MNTPTRKAPTVASLLLATVFLFPTAGASAPCVPGGMSPGWNIFQTNEVITHFDPDGAAGPLPNLHFKGVPLGTFDFPGHGVYGTGAGDTVIHHDGGAPGVPIATHVERLQLQAVEMPTLFVTLSSDRGRNILDPPSTTPSTGSITLTGPGTFDSSLDVYFDIRVGSVDGPILPDALLSAVGIPHHKEFHSPSVSFNRIGNEQGAFAETDNYGDASHAVKGPTVLITDVNSVLNGVDFSCDFHPGFL